MKLSAKGVTLQLQDEAGFISIDASN